VNRNKMISISVVSIAIVALAVTAVSADFSKQSTPLYTYRMEQLSNKMSFLPTEINDFAYNAKGEYTLDYEVSGANGAVPAGPVSWGRITCGTCDPTCWSGCYTNEAVGC
jgi:hypothetical protein